eukprot:scaffold58433_cov23-Cyclotella_meneghiniana.AAC.1
MNNLVAAAAAMENESMRGGGGTKNTKIGAAAPMTSSDDGAVHDASSRKREASNSSSSSSKDIPAAKARRLEQNRRAAIESRRRKKVLMEELKRSVAFYTKSNATIAQHNRELEHRLILAKQRLNEMGLSTATAAPSSAAAAAIGDYETNTNDPAVREESKKSIQEESHVQEFKVQEPVSHVNIKVQDDCSKQKPQEKIMSYRPPMNPVAPEPLPIANTQPITSNSTENENQSEEDEYIKALKKVRY